MIGNAALEPLEPPVLGPRMVAFLTFSRRPQTSLRGTPPPWRHKFQRPGRSALNLISQLLEPLSSIGTNWFLSARGIDGFSPVVELLPSCRNPARPGTRGEKGFAQVALPFGNQATAPARS